MRLYNVLTSLVLASSVSAQIVTSCVSGGVCYAVNIPKVSSSSGSGDIYIHITGPSNMSWIGIGQGTSMTGSNIFNIHANEAGNNVTLSPRLGTGHKPPLNSASTAQVTLLAGSGIVDGRMTANFRCSNCNSWTGGSMSFTNPQSNWIWAYRTGAPVASNSLSANLAYHSSFGTMALNLQSAAGGASTNPFLGVIASNHNTGSAFAGAGTRSKYTTILIAHGVLGSLAFVVFYPLGAIIIRTFTFRNAVWVHAGWMVFTYFIALASMGLGVWLAVTAEALSTYHAIIGIVVIGSLLLQPITGLLHHHLFKSRGTPNVATIPHVWWGRATVTLGVINGGLGLKLADNTRGGEIAYGVVAGFMWLLWMGVSLMTFVGKKGQAKKTISHSSDEKPTSQQESLRMSDERKE